MKRPYQFSRRPSHPGELLREEILPGAQMTQAELAQALRVSRVTVSEVVLEKRGITPDLALRLGQFFGNGPEWSRQACDERVSRLGAPRRPPQIQSEPH